MNLTPHFRLLFSVIGVGILLVARSAYADPVMGVVISEVCWMGSDMGIADEWVEIANVGDPIDISGWSLTGIAGDGTERVLHQFSAETILHADQFFTIGNFESEQSRLESGPDIITSGMSLPNTKLLLRLYDGSGTLMDTVDDGIGTPFAGQNASGVGMRATMERIDLSLPGNDQTNWRAANTSRGIDAGAPLLGTPGFANGTADDVSEPAEIPAEEQTETSSSSFSSSAPPPVFLLPPIRITEILPDPEGSDDAEWIEILNTGSGSVDLVGAQLSSGEKTFTFTAQFFSGAIIQPSQHLLLPKTVTGLSLPNGGGDVSFSMHATVIDAWTYSAVPEGVSIGRLSADDAPRMLCNPTPGAANSVAIPDVSISLQSVSAHALQSGNLISAEGKVSLNLEALVFSESRGGQCSWNFGDGFTSANCNPPSHAFTERGAYTVLLVFQDACGSVAEQSLLVSVTDVPESSPSTVPVSRSEEPAQTEEEECIPSAFGGVTISEFLPNPAGSDETGEWIELRNSTASDVHLCGWAIDDGEGGSPEAALDAERIPAGGYLVLPRSRTGLALNNDSDHVRVFSPSPEQEDATLLGDISYTSSKEGRSYALFSGAWSWTMQLTPGGGNPAPIVEAKNSGEAVSSNMSSFSSLALKGNKKSEQKLYSNKENSPQSAIAVRYENALPWLQEEKGASGAVLPASHAHLLQGRGLGLPEGQKAEMGALNELWLLPLMVSGAGLLLWKGSFGS
jgi:PKD repeat protein